MTSATVVGALAIVVGAAVAHADPAARVAAADPPATASDPDPATVESAREANLVSDAPRTGVQLTGAIGGSLTLGVGVDNAVGKGGAASVRLGAVATRTTVLTFEVVGGGFLHETGNASTTVSNAIDVLAGAQVYTSDSLWVRAAGGLGTFTRNVVGDPAHVSGVAGVIGAGVDIAKLHYVTFDVEIFWAGMLAGGGLVATSGLCIGATL